MTTTDNTQSDVYNQIMKVEKHMDALKDVYENIPDTDRYHSVISILCEGLKSELKPLYSLALKLENDTIT